MLDLSYFQNSGNVNTQTFTNAGSWVTWLKPRGAKFVNIMCIGSGAGGGGGAQRLNAATRGAGGAGGGGGLIRAQFQASILPDILYVYTGVGGTAGAGGLSGSQSNGGNGERSVVCLIPDTSSISNIVVTSGAVSSRGGVSGSDTASGTGGAGETVTTTANTIFLNLGTFIALAGPAGSAAAQSTTTTPTSILFSAAWGVSPASAGGVVNGSGPFLTLTAGTSGAAPTNGKDGIILYKPVLGFMGGSGGGAATGTNIGNAGNGGNGAFGCGGGGGGTSYSGTAGAGGKGGDGIIIITTSF